MLRKQHPRHCEAFCSLPAFLHSGLQAAEELAGTWDGVWGAWHTPALVYDGVSGCMEVWSKGSKLIFVSLES